MDIGIEKDHFLVYEGHRPYGRALWPSPIITPAKIVYESEGPLVAEQKGAFITSACRFREDQYDPIARIRRGRFYFAEGIGSQPMQWYLQPHPALANEVAGPNIHEIQKSLETFTSNSIWHKYINGKHEQPLILLGLDNRFTIWTIINVEVLSTGEDLVTLKARSSLGVLPRIYEDKIPKKFRGRVAESLDAFVDEAHRSAPISVIDRARDAASQMTLAYYNATGKDAKDLGQLIKRLEDDRKIVAASAARIIARLHARAKPSERERQNLRPIREQDAQLAIQCVGTMLCELGWADWA